MGAYSYEYGKLKDKYGDFLYPIAKLIINDKDLSEKKEDFVIENIEIELSCGYEASAVSFDIFYCFDEIKQKYKIDEIKKYICLGAPISAAVGYGGSLLEVFKGFIANVTFLRQEEETHHMEITALDVKGMMMANCCARQMTAASYGEGIKELFQKNVYEKMQSWEIYTDLKVTDTPDKNDSGGNDKARTEHVDMLAESDYDFAVKAAKRFNYEFFVEDGVVYFRKSKATKGCLMKIGQKEGILTYEISYDITGLVESVEARGTDIRKAESFIAKKKVKNKISLGNKAKSLISQTEKVYIDGSIHSKEQAENRVESLVEEMSFRFGKLECRCIGIPEILPGYYIDIDGFGGPANNRFYVTNVKHCISEEGGFTTEISGKAAQLQ